MAGMECERTAERTQDRLEIVPYDPEWPARFQRWRWALASALRDTAVSIEHVGSTAVPGLPAKPIVDTQVSVAELADEDRYVPVIERLGLQLRSRDDLHRYFRPFPGQPRDAQVHVCGAGSTWEEEHLRFRDHLRRYPRERARYAEVKRDAAALWADDRVAYTAAKTETILRILRAAEGETER